MITFFFLLQKKEQERGKAPIISTKANHEEGPALDATTQVPNKTKKKKERKKERTKISEDKAMPGKATGVAAARIFLPGPFYIYIFPGCHVVHCNLGTHCCWTVRARPPGLIWNLRGSISFRRGHTHAFWGVDNQRQKKKDKETTATITITLKKGRLKGGGCFCRPPASSQCRLLEGSWFFFLSLPKP